MVKPKAYTITTWDAEIGEFTPQDGLELESQSIPLSQVRHVFRELKEYFGYTCHRNHYDSDPSVLIEADL